MKEELIYIGGKIRAERKAQNMSQECLAEDADISTRPLQKIEKGDVEMKIGTFIKICDALGASPNSLLPERLSENEVLSNAAFQIIGRLEQLSSNKREKVIHAFESILDAVEM